MINNISFFIPVAEIKDEYDQVRNVTLIYDHVNGDHLVAVDPNTHTLFSFVEDKVQDLKNGVEYDVDVHRYVEQM